MGEAGKTFGFNMVGLSSIYQVVVAHHVLLFVATNSIDPFYLLMFPFSFVWVWLVGFLEDINSMSNYHYSIYTDLFRSSVFWLQFFLGTTLMVLPFYVFLKWRQFFGGDPRHDIACKRAHLSAKVGNTPQSANKSDN